MMTTRRTADRDGSGRCSATAVREGVGFGEGRNYDTRMRRAAQGSPGESTRCPSRVLAFSAVFTCDSFDLRHSTHTCRALQPTMRPAERLWKRKYRLPTIVGAAWYRLRKRVGWGARLEDT